MIIKLAIALVVVLIVAAFAAWAFLPARHLPGNRARHLRIRLHLRLHPGKGFVHLLSLHLRWSRFAALRRSSRIRPALPLHYRILDPREHSVFLGRAHYRHGLRVPLEEHVLVMAPPRTFKTESGPRHKWRAPDSLGYNEHIGAVAAIVSQHLEEALTRRFGLEWTARDDGHGFEIEDPGIAGVDIWKMDDESKALEHWDTLHPVGTPDDAAPWVAPGLPHANQDGMF